MFSHPKTKLFALILVLVGLIAACTPTTANDTGSADVAPEVAPRTITVTGLGKAYGDPDEANLTVGVETFKETAQAAVDENEATIQSVITTLEELGVAEKDIQTSNYSLWVEQRYGENGPEGIAGYRVSNQMNIKVRDISKVGSLLTAVTEAGANQIYGVNFTVADPAALSDEARDAAIADAQRRAEYLANLTGVELGEVQTVQELGDPGYYGPMGGMGGGGGGGVAFEEASISPGQLLYNIQVQITYAVK